MRKKKERRPLLIPIAKARGIRSGKLMKETLNMGIQIDKELIENNVSNAVCVAIASALGDKDELIVKAVKAVVSSYVDTEGRPCSSGSYRAIPYLKYLAEQSVKESVKN